MMNQPIPVYIRGSGSFVPDKVLNNAYFQSYLDTSDEWIVSRSGIRERRQLPPHQATSYMAAEAGKRAIADAGLKPEDIDALIIATATPDTLVPSTAAWAQSQIGLPPTVPSFDINAACSGFVYGFSVGQSLVMTGFAKNLLLIGAETLTRITDYEDRATCVLFGDAAGAAVLSKSSDPQRQILYYEVGMDGRRTEDIWVPAGGSRLPASVMTANERLHFMKMKGRELYKFAVVKMQELIDRSLEKTGLTADQLKLIVPHQSNLRMIESARERLKLPIEKFAINIDRYGNTSAASIPVAFDEARRTGRIVPGDAVLMMAIGAGVTWGSILFRV